MCPRGPGFDPHPGIFMGDLLRLEFRQPFLDFPWPKIMPWIVKSRLQKPLCEREFRSLWITQLVILIYHTLYVEYVGKKEDLRPNPTKYDTVSLLRGGNVFGQLTRFTMIRLDYATYTLFWLKLAEKCIFLSHAFDLITAIRSLI